MEQDLFQPLQGADPLLRVFVEETRKEVFYLRGELDVVREGELVFNNGLFDLMFVS